MSRRRSPSNNDKSAALGALALAACAWPTHAHAQACCAASGALTPGRLSLHEDALAGAQVKAASVFGSFDPESHYAASPARASEYDLEEDLFGAVRIFERAQLALLVPFLQTSRTAGDASEFGGGLGDINLSARYDFYFAGQSRLMPGIALLAGVTFPSGTAPESANRPLATDATGAGAFQGNVGLAFEQVYGAWLINVTGLLAERAARSVRGVDETLGAQLTALAGTAYTFSNEAALALFVSYTVEADATIAGVEQPRSARRITLLSFSGVWPLSDHWRLQGSAFLDPPLSGLGANLPATAGVTLTGIRSW